MNERIIQEQRKVYTETFKLHGPTPQGVCWNNIETQTLRFERLIKNIEEHINGDSIHDVGAGVCDLHKYLLTKNIRHEYSGTEIVQEMIDYSMNEYQNIKLVNRDLLNANKNEVYNFIVLSGTLNLINNENQKDWKDYCYKLIKKMYLQADKAIVFNCLTSYKTFSDPTLLYFDPIKIFDFCAKNLSRFVIIDHGYPLYEFTCTVFRPEYLSKSYNNQKFNKYFSAL